MFSVFADRRLQQVQKGVSLQLLTKVKQGQEAMPGSRKRKAPPVSVKKEDGEVPASVKKIEAPTSPVAKRERRSAATAAAAIKASADAFVKGEQQAVKKIEAASSPLAKQKQLKQQQWSSSEGGPFGDYARPTAAECEVR
jgi:hypothetical protein